jgi:predicted amidohydrolase YtcJ
MKKYFSRFIFLAAVAVLACLAFRLPAGSVPNRTAAPTAQPQAAPMQAISGEPAPQKATIFVAKKIITMEDTGPAQAVAVAGDRIVAVGSLDDVKKALKGRDYTVDLTFARKVITPGLIDPHLHLWLFALAAPMKFITPDDWDLPWGYVKGVEGRETYLSELTAAEKALKDPNAWLCTWGYHQYWHGKLSRQDLDDISATRPIVVWHRSAHEMYFNTAAIKALGITKESLQGHGNPSSQTDFDNGHFWEAGLFELVAPALFPILATPEKFAKGLMMTKQYVEAGGLTTTADPGIILPPGILQVLKTVFDSPDTSFRNLLIASGQVLYEKYGEAGALAATEGLLALNGHRVAYLPKQVKLFCDGAAYSQMMQMKDGYLDGHQGAWIEMPEELAASARLYWNDGYQIRVHVNGDLGVEVTLGVLSNLMRDNPRFDHRFSLDHFCVSAPDQIKQIKALDAIVSVNPYYVYVLADKYSQIGLGAERASTMVRSNSLVRNHVKLSLHSDTPMAPARPMLLAWEAVNRATMTGKVAGPEEKISVQDALRAITIDAAYFLQKEKEIGSIAPGKTADFTIFESDPLTVEPMKIKDIPIWGTVFEGQVFPIKRPAGKASASAAGITHGSTPLLSNPFSGGESDEDCCVCSANQWFQKIVTGLGTKQ